MSSRTLRVPLVVLLALAVVSVCIVFVVLRLVSEPPLVYEEEIPVVDKEEIPVFAVEVSTISVPIKADYAALTSEIRDAARKKITIPGPVSSGAEKIYQEKPFKAVFYYRAELLSLDFSVGDGSASLAQTRRELERMRHGVASPFLTAKKRKLEQQLQQRITKLEAVADRPVLTVEGKVHLHGPIQQKQYFWWPINDWKYMLTLANYDGKFEFSKLYTVKLDKTAKLIFVDVGKPYAEASGLAKLTVLKIPFEDWFGVLEAKIVPVLEEKIDGALKKHVNQDYLTRYYKKGWEELHKPIWLADGVWLVFHPEEFEAAQLRGSGTMLETTVTVRGRPEVVLGQKPGVLQVPSVPPVRLGEAKGDLHVVVDAIVPLDEAERLLNKELGGLEKVMYKQAKVKVKVPKARIYSRENWLRLELVLTKPFRGSVFLEGVPKYDAEKNELYVEGLDFTAETKNLLAKSASLLLENRLFKDYLQTKVRLPVGGPLAKAGESISGYEKEVADGVLFQLGNMSVKMLAVYNTREAMHFIVQADGWAEVTMKSPEPSPSDAAPSPPSAVVVTGVD